MNKTTFSTIAVTMFVMVAAAPLALADEVVLAHGVGTTLRSQNHVGLDVGDSFDVNYWIDVKDGNGRNYAYVGCDAADGSSATLTFTLPDGISASPSSLVFTSCAAAQTVTFTATGSVRNGKIDATVSDANGHYNNAPFFFVTADVVELPAPTLIVPSSPVGLTATSAQGAWNAFAGAPAVNEVADPNAVYAFVGSSPVPVTCSVSALAFAPADGAQFAPGRNTVACSATANGKTATASFPVDVTFLWSGFSAPITANGKGLFRVGSTIPVKMQVLDADGAPIAGLSPQIRVSLVSVTTNADGTTSQTYDTLSLGDAGNTFRYDASAGQYIFNLGTKGRSTGTYLIEAILGDESAPIMGALSTGARGTTVGLTAK